MAKYQVTIPVLITVDTDDPNRAGVDFFQEFVMRRSNDFTKAHINQSTNPSYGEITGRLLDEKGDFAKVEDEEPIEDEE
jgi:hypothetical protein